jgi:hypothetical protein
MLSDLEHNLEGPKAMFTACISNIFHGAHTAESIIPFPIIFLHTSNFSIPIYFVLSIPFPMSIVYRQCTLKVNRYSFFEKK